ncbi:glycerol-3-phosphate 1-O-acyltransferase PlsY [Acanthopleuribacter pedis]|uniref:Glycerol-3-phosphate acyltransferase n=1 Tax=Acanthopleuribacter pedis TaxID=442870 RepID=A0A8J7U284_9BACT|nr:glycerol-3-phosphate 1-O-acyltransferase PlsY [Acanthopleuribacter pedis]MBO1317444.1 glycerol-3-phosphate 1-O-acyltransferase PlsY [Acanthopleuribacter pedis]
MTWWLGLIVVPLAGYLVGSVPTALWVGRLLRGVDIRDHGSGNAGATNALRVFGWKIGLFVLLVDMGKGFVACWWLWRLGPLLSPAFELLSVSWQLIAGFAAVLGHIFSVFAGFRGGKGVGTAAGMFLALLPVQTALVILLFVLVTWRFRWVSLGSLSAAATLPLLVWVSARWAAAPIPAPLVWTTTGVALLIFAAHHQNIRRLRQGREPRLGEEPQKKGRAGS